MNEELMEYPQENLQQISRKNDGFLEWFLENKKGIENLKYLWRGWERNMKGFWEKPADSEIKRLMNEKGIHWASGVLENYLDRVFQSTNWNDEHLNYQMRKAYRVVWFGLMSQWKDFQISKVNTQGIATQMLSRIHAMLLASRANGLRDFIGTTQSISEHRVVQPQEKRGFFSGLAGAFSQKSYGGQQ